MLKLKERISDTIKREIEDFKKDYKISDKYSFNQYDTVRRINLYLNDQYVKKQEEDVIFWNIINPRLVHFAKNIDLDTKDLQPVAKGNANFMQGWILKMRFQKWCRDNHLSLTLNDLSEGIATYGSIVWKLYYDYETKEKRLVEASLENLYFNPSVKSVRKAPVVELAYMSELEIREKEGAWDNIDDLVKNSVKTNGEAKQDNTGNSCVNREIWERWGEVLDDSGKIHYMHYIGGGYGDKEVIAYEEETDADENPYWDFHIGRYRGRWMRVGVPERLFKCQERANAVVNLNAEATQIASLLLLRTNDPNTTGNVLQGAISGQIINSADLQQIGISNNAFTLLLNELASIEKQADRLCLTPEVVTGEMTPSGTPFRSVAALSQNAKSAFVYIRQSIGEAVGYLLTEEILPSVVKNWNRGEMLDICDDLQDINLYDDQLVMHKKIEYIESANANDKVVTEEELAKFEEEFRANINKTGRTVDITKNFFNFDYGITVNVNGEAVDKNAKNDAYSNIVQWKQANPEIVNDPYFRQYCEDNGITPFRMTTAQIQKQVQGMAAGKPQGSQPAAPAPDLMAAIGA